MKILQTYVFTYNDLINNLDLLSFLNKLDNYLTLESKDKFSIFYVFKTKEGIFLERPELKMKNKYFPKVLIDITKYINNFNLD